MVGFFKPDIKLNNIYELTGEILSSLSVSVLIADLDNTLAKYENEVPDEKLAAWVKSLSEHGVSLAVVSNNDRPRVEKFCAPLGVDFYWKSGKPRRKTLKLAMEKLGGRRETTALVGDKFTTDILGAKMFGIFSIKVKPLGKRRMFE